MIEATLENEAFLYQSECTNIMGLGLDSLLII